MAFNSFQPYGGYQQAYLNYMQQGGYPAQPFQNGAGAAVAQGGIVSPPAPSTGFACRPVTSRAEVDAFQIPFDGSTTYFVDTSTGKIYAKRFDQNTGTAPVVTYIPEAAIPVPQYATIDDLNQLREELLKKQRKVVKKNEPDEPDE